MFIIIINLSVLLAISILILYLLIVVHYSDHCGISFMVTIVVLKRNKIND